MKLKLPPGTTGFFNDQNEWICTGAMMGRRNTLPTDLPQRDEQSSYRLRLIRLRFVDGCYDQGGAYWGSPANIYIATEGARVYSPSLPGFELLPCGVTVYVRSNSRQEAKQAVRKLVPTAKFYR